jgi:hypothetical protein
MFGAVKVKASICLSLCSLLNISDDDFPLQISVLTIFKQSVVSFDPPPNTYLFNSFLYGGTRFMAYMGDDKNLQPQLVGFINQLVRAKCVRPAVST